MEIQEALMVTTMVTQQVTLMVQAISMPLPMRRLREVALVTPVLV